MKTILIGVFESGSFLNTNGTKVQLTHLSVNTSISLNERPFLPSREREGTLAIVKGDLQSNILYNAEVVEIAPSWISHSLIELLNKNELVWDGLIDQINESRIEIIGSDILEDPTPTQPINTNKPLLALVIGHRKSDKGAENREVGINEFDFNSEIADRVKQKVSKAKVELVFRDDVKNGYTLLPAKINAIKPQFIISLHCNAVNKKDVGGTEMLYYYKSRNGHKMAKIMQKKVLNAFGFNDRNTKKISQGNRGLNLLKNTKAPCIIAEPFFLSKNSEAQTVLNNKQKLVDAYVKGIHEICDEMF